jgi:DNA-binding transcriptional LysR family regulator
MVLDGEGVTVLPVSTLHDDLVAGRCAAFPVDDANLHRILVLAHAAAQPRSPAVDEVLRLVRTEIDRLAQLGVFHLPAPRRERRRAARR